MKYNQLLLLLLFILKDLNFQVLIHSEKRLSRGKLLKKAKSKSEKVSLDVIHGSNIASEGSVVFPPKPVLARSPSLLKVDNVLRNLSSITGKHIKFVSTNNMLFLCYLF